MSDDPAQRSAPRRRRAERGPGADERGDYAIFIAVIATALLLFGGIAYDAPRLIAARQHAVHTANEAARVAAATVAAGGTRIQASDAAARRAAEVPLLYGAPTRMMGMECAGPRVEVTVATWYSNRSILAVFRDRQDIVATGAAEAQWTGPHGQIAQLGHVYLPECPLPGQ